MSAKVKEQLDVHEDNLDGVFWMEIEDFHKNFYNTTICHYKKNYKCLTVADTHGPTGHGVCRLEVGEDITSDGATFLIS